MMLKVNGISYKVMLDDAMEDLGQFYADEQIIKIRKTPKCKILSTIKHELTHAYLYSYGFSQVELNEEIICDFFEMYGERIIADSKKVYKYLVG